MRIYLMQHGDALPESVNPDRPLSDEGRIGVMRLAKFLRGGPCRVGRAIHSGKTRARQTAELMAAELASTVAPEALPGLGPNDPVEPVAAWMMSAQEETLLVGHMPFLGRLASRLLAASDDAVTVSFRPGSLACLERQPTGSWSLAWMIRPELLRA